MQSSIDAVSTTLLGDLVRRTFRREVCGKGFGVRDTGEVSAFENVLVVGFGGEEKGRRFGIDDCC